MFSGDTNNVESTLVGIEMEYDDLDFCTAVIDWQVALKNFGWRVVKKKAIATQSLFKPKSASGNKLWH